MRKIFALIVCAASALFMFGCTSDSGKDQIESSESVSETSEEETSTTVAESVETEASAETTEESVSLPVIEADSTGYYVNCPLDMGQQYIYVRCIPGFDFYPDEVDGTWDKTWYELYIKNEMTSFTLFTSPDTAEMNGNNADIEVSLNSQFDIEWCFENAETGWTGDGTTYLEIGEPEICENGIKIYEIKTTILNDNVDFIQTDYLLDYEIDEDNRITFYLHGLVPTTAIPQNPEDTYYIDNPPGPAGFEGYLEPILDFYRTTEDPFLIVDKDATVIWSP